jgi:hypothetical protein
MAFVELFETLGGELPWTGLSLDLTCNTVVGDARSRLDEAVRGSSVICKLSPLVVLETGFGR